MRAGRAVLARARRVLAPRRFPAAVLLYHRVADLETDPWDLSVSPRTFESHLAVLRRRFRPVSLRRLRADLADGRLEPRSVAVTFDDGYADNLVEAEPLLDRYGIPATVFVVTAALDSGMELWWDELEGLVLAPESVPATLTLSIGARELTWQLGSSARQENGAHGAHPRWRASSEPPTRRHALYLDLWKLLRPLPSAAREGVLDQLRRWAERPPEARPTHRTLSTGEARELAGREVAEVGAHTVTHPVLASLTVDDQRAEMGASKRALERLIGRDVTQLSYPFGGLRDYSHATVSLAEELGFEVGCTNRAAGVDARTNPLELPRIYIRDCHPAAFEKSLSMWVSTR